jgi:RNA polymerase sigma-70 factor (ECF subfamily)
LIGPELAASDSPGASRERTVTSPQERSISDAALITRVREGSAGVEDLVYWRLAPVVNRLVWSLLGPDSEHNDIAHDIFIRVFRGIRRVQDPARLEHWAARITINTVYNEMRRRRLRRWVFWSAPEEVEPLGPAVDLEGREVLAKTYQVLALLPQSERLVLALALFEGKKLDSIAELTGRSRSTVKRRLRRARERFQKLCQQDPLLSAWVGSSAAISEDDDG